jgi:hypothetical protein
MPPAGAAAAASPDWTTRAERIVFIFIRFYQCERFEQHRSPENSSLGLDAISGADGDAP